MPAGPAGSGPITNYGRFGLLNQETQSQNYGPGPSTGAGKTTTSDPGYSSSNDVNAASQNLVASGGGNISGLTGGGGLVFMGPPLGGHAKQLYGPDQPVSQESATMSLQDAENLYFTWDQKQVDAFRAKVGLVDNSALSYTDHQLSLLWKQYVDDAATKYSQGNMVTPWDLLNGDISSASGSKSKAGKDFQRTITTEATTSRPDANAVFTAAAQSLLGRAPTADELSGFYNNLHSLELANPLVKTINYHYLPGQSFYPSEDITKQTGGVSAQAQQNLALQQAKQNPEYGAYQAATTYMGALQELLGGGKV